MFFTGVLMFLGGYVLAKNIVVPAIEGAVDGFKEGRAELKKDKAPST